MDKSSKDFKKLQNKWYKKLAKTGFQDIEEDHHGSQKLKHYCSNYFWIQYKPERFNARAEYFVAAGHFLYSYKFESELEKRIWLRHSEGETIIGIVAILRKEGFKTYRRAVHETIQKLVNIMLTATEESYG